MSTPINNISPEPSIEEQIAAARAEAKAEAEAELSAVKAENEALAKQKQKLEESIKSGTAVATIKGKFKGYSFEPGHARVRNRSGELCDTQLLMDAANDKNSPANADAVQTLTWLIDIQYAYLVK